MNFLKSAVASAIAQGPPFPYTFGDKVDIDKSIWTLYNGTKRVSHVALDFVCQFTNCVSLGGRVKLQHLLLRHHQQPIPTSPSQERPQEATNPTTPWSY